MPRVRFPDIRIRRSEYQLKMQLQSLVYDYRSNTISKSTLRLRGEQILRKHHEATGRDVEQWMTSQGIQLTMQDKSEHQTLLAQALEEWGKIVADVKRM